jgi:hypothetical protein
MHQRREDAPLGELFAELTREMTTLVQHEARLASTEIGERSLQVGRYVAVLAVGGAVAYAGFLAIVAAVILFFANFIRWWLSALIVGVAIAGAGLVLVQKVFEALKKLDLTPHHTIRTIKEDVEWARQQTN